MCGSLYRTCCLSLSPFLSTPKKLLLQKDLCLPLGERRTRRTAAPRHQHSGRGGCNRRRPPASKAPRRGRPGAARDWAPRYGTSSWWKPHYLESRSLRLLSPLHRTTHPCHRARRACATPHATPRRTRRRTPPPRRHTPHPFLLLTSCRSLFASFASKPPRSPWEECLHGLENYGL